MAPLRQGCSLLNLSSLIPWFLVCLFTHTLVTSAYSSYTQVVQDLAVPLWRGRVPSPLSHLPVLSFSFQDTTGEVKLINLINQLYQDVYWCGEKIFRQAFDINYQITKDTEGILLCSPTPLRGSISLQILHAVEESGMLWGIVCRSNLSETH